MTETVTLVGAGPGGAERPAVVPAKEEAGQQQGGQTGGRGRI